MHQPRYRQILTDFKRLDTILNPLYAYLSHLVRVYQMVLSVQDISRERKKIFDSNSQRPGEFATMKMRHVLRFVEYVWDRASDEWDDKRDMVFGDLRVGDRI